jgi:hypothetical protein
MGNVSRFLRIQSLDFLFASSPDNVVEQKGYGYSGKAFTQIGCSVHVRSDAAPTEG